MSIKIGSTTITRVESNPPIEYIKQGSNIIFNNQYDVIFQMYDPTYDSVLTDRFKGSNVLGNATTNRYLDVTNYSANGGPYSQILQNNRPYAVASCTIGDTLTVTGGSIFTGTKKIFTGATFTPTINNNYTSKITGPGVPLAYYNSLTCYDYTAPSPLNPLYINSFCSILWGPNGIQIVINFDNFELNTYSNIKLNLTFNSGKEATITRTAMKPSSKQLVFTEQWSHTQYGAPTSAEIMIVVSPTYSSDMKWYTSTIGPISIEI